MSQSGREIGETDVVLSVLTERQSMFTQFPPAGDLDIAPGTVVTNVVVCVERCVGDCNIALER